MKTKKKMVIGGAIWGIMAGVVFILSILFKVDDILPILLVFFFFVGLLWTVRFNFYFLISFLAGLVITLIILIFIFEEKLPKEQRLFPPPIEQEQPDPETPKPTNKIALTLTFN